MNATSFSTELRTGNLTQKEFLSIALQAGTEMGWQVVEKTAADITFHVPGNAESYGESVNLTIQTGLVTFTSCAVNTDHWPEDRNELNAENFRLAVSGILERKRRAQQTPYPKSGEKFSVLIPSRTYLITPLLLYANVIVLTAMVVMGVSLLNPSTEKLVAWGGNFRPLTTHGDWWRLLTSIFIHSGIIHLAANMYALVYVGIYLEPLLGKLRFSMSYVLSGVCGALVSLYFHPYSVSVGASGAIFGLYGVFMAILTTAHIEKEMRIVMLRSILLFVIFNLIYGIKGNVDNAAHVGGLVSGLAIGYAYYPGLRRQANFYLQGLISIFLSVAVTLACVFVLPSFPDDMSAFRQKLAHFVELETLALEVFRMPADAPKEDIIYNLRDRGIYYWNENKKVLEEMEKLSVPPLIQEKELQMRRYCDYRIEQYDLMAKQLEENNTRYEKKIELLRKKISELLADIKKESGS